MLKFYFSLLGTDEKLFISVYLLVPCLTCRDTWEWNKLNVLARWHEWKRREKRYVTFGSVDRKLLNVFLACIAVIYKNTNLNPYGNKTYLPAFPLMFDILFKIDLRFCAELFCFYTLIHREIFFNDSMRNFMVIFRAKKFQSTYYPLLRNFFCYNS